MILLIWCQVVVRIVSVVQRGSRHITTETWIAWLGIQEQGRLVEPKCKSACSGGGRKSEENLFSLGFSFKQTFVAEEAFCWIIVNCFEVP